LPKRPAAVGPAARPATSELANGKFELTSNSNDHRRLTCAPSGAPRHSSARARFTLIVGC